MSKKVIITGATGMIGALILQNCLENDQVREVISLGRRETGMKHPKFREIIVSNFLSYTPTDDTFEQVDLAFCCIGVYTGAVPKEVFRKITTDIPVALGKTLYQSSPQAKYCLLSGGGADRTEKSRMMFARDKGAAENQMAAIGFNAFHTFRPGYIYPVTKRKEPNFSYRIFRQLYPLVKLFGKNASIKSTELAQAMVNVGLNGQIKQEVFENRDILKYL